MSTFRLAAPATTRVGWIGTGVMGRSMCGHLLAAGYRVTVTTRTRDKAADLLQRGAAWADQPRQVAEQSDVICTMVGYPADVRAVILGPEGVLAGCQPGAIVVDLTTSEPSLAEEIHAAASSRGVGALDAPVSGGDVGAREARLSIMVGGPEAVLAAVRPLLEVMGKTIVHQGPAGAGQHTKMVNQILIASTMVGVAEGMLYAYRSGLDPVRVLESVGGGAAASFSLNVLGARMIRRDFEPGFYVEHFIKDMGIALAEAERLRLCLPGLALAKQLYEAVRAQGLGRKGTQALLLALERIANVTPPAPPPAPKAG
ncbi:MAG TPA: NAD(P)-dependent oxidoreductase [Gemmatales bacterium]|nr:NAD(P)-dependent oxidoreductase [Gemmatales bacterium]HMP59938.1 NAD(P)-dependent oxidoreductase [Gemmatales bacterium]